MSLLMSPGVLITGTIYKGFLSIPSFLRIFFKPRKPPSHDKFPVSGRLTTFPVFSLITQYWDNYSSYRHQNQGKILCQAALCLQGKPSLKHITCSIKYYQTAIVHQAFQYTLRMHVSKTHKDSILMELKSSRENTALTNRQIRYSQKSGQMQRP